MAPYHKGLLYIAVDIRSYDMLAVRKAVSYRCCRYVHIYIYVCVCVCACVSENEVSYSNI